MSEFNNPAMLLFLAVAIIFKWIFILSEHSLMSSLQFLES
jgi:hypothetical protein